MSEVRGALPRTPGFNALRFQKAGKAALTHCLSALCKPGTALMSLPSVALSSVSVKQRQITIFS